jgi:hypothetical protein
MPTITCTLAGAKFRPAEARAAVKELQLGQALELEPDPENEYDSQAVRVFTYDEWIGFIPKADNGPIFAALQRGEAVGCEVVAFESSLKPVLEITLP